MRDRVPPSGRAFWVLVYGPLILVVILLIPHVLAVVRDFVAAIGTPLEIDYGEGIVWQQAVLIPGPAMYSPSQALPFIVFHYPPLFHIVTRAAAGFMPSFLAAGRLVSVSATLSIAMLVGAIVRTATRVPDRNLSSTDLLSIMIAGMLVLCLHAVHFWGMVMRVDTLAIAFAVAGVLVGLRGDGRLLPTVAGLLLCLCAVFTKQTQVSSGVALFLLTLVRAPRSALLAAAITGVVGFGILGVLQWVTHGGFLINIINYNINRFSLQAFYNTFDQEKTSLFIVVPALVSIPIMLQPLWQRGGVPPYTISGSRAWLHAKVADRAAACRILLALYLLLSTLTLVMTFKSGSNFNYFLEWLVLNCAVLGVGISDLARGWSRRSGSAVLVALLVPVLIFLLFMPTRPLLFLHDKQALALREKLVALIASAAKPVASDNMTLLMQAGKRVTFEPAIVTELAEIGLWNDKPLVAMIKARQFAFIITIGAEEVQATRRTTAVKAAIDDAYPKVEQLGPGTWVNSPP